MPRRHTTHLVLPPTAYRLPLTAKHAPKADGVALGVIGNGPAGGGTKEWERIPPRSSAHHLGQFRDARLPTSAVLWRVFVIGVPAVADVFPQVAVHVVQPPSVRLECS